MQLVELVIELCDHLLDIRRLLLSVELLEDGNLDVVFL